LARHETRDLGEWEGAERGGVQGDEGMASVTDERARSGRWGLRLTNPADHLDAGGCIGRGFESLSEAYFSAWYFLPAAPTALSAWTVLRVRSLSPASADDPLAEEGMGGQGGAAGAPGTTLPEWRS